MSKTKFKLTEEQQKAKEQKEAKLKELIKKVSEMTPEQLEEFAKTFPVLTAEGHMVSPRNIHLLTCQLETVTMVGGFQQWLAKGRAVKKGEKALSILAPQSKKSTNDNGEESSEVYYRYVSVFDISQTEEIETKEKIEE